MLKDQSTFDDDEPRLRRRVARKRMRGLPRVTTYYRCTSKSNCLTVARLLELVGLHDDDEDAASAAGGTTGAAERAPPVCTVHDGSAAGGAPGSSSADGPPTGRDAQGTQGGGSRRNAL